jgi:hypothetical protein
VPYAQKKASRATPGVFHLFHCRKTGLVVYDKREEKQEEIRSSAELNSETKEFPFGRATELDH